MLPTEQFELRRINAPKRMVWGRIYDFTQQGEIEDLGYQNDAMGRPNNVWTATADIRSVYTARIGDNIVAGGYFWTITAVRFPEYRFSIYNYTIDLQTNVEYAD